MGESEPLVDKILKEEAIGFKEDFEFYSDELDYFSSILPKLREKLDSESLLYKPIKALLKAGIIEYLDPYAAYAIGEEFKTCHELIAKYLPHAKKTGFTDDDAIENMIYLSHAKVRLTDLIFDLTSILEQRIYTHYLPHFFTDEYTHSLFQDHTSIYFASDGVAINYFEHFPTWIRPTHVVSLFGKQTFGVNYWGMLDSGRESKRERVAVVYLPFYSVYRTRFFVYLAHEAGHLFTFYGRKKEDIKEATHNAKKGIGNLEVCQHYQKLSDYLSYFDEEFIAPLLYEYFREIQKTYIGVTDQLFADMIANRIGGPGYSFAYFANFEHKLSALRGFEENYKVLTVDVIISFFRFLLLSLDLSP